MTVNVELIKQKSRKALRKALWIGSLLLILAAAAYYLYRNFPVGENEQSGTLFSLSHTGYLFKTYEGQLHLIGSAVLSKQSVWHFSVKDKATYERLQTQVGQNVKLLYKELPQTALPWKGKTKYIVYDIKPLE